MNSPKNSDVRSSLYALLARLFTYPLDGETLESVAELSLNDGSVEGKENLIAALTMMQTAIADDSDSVDLLEALHCEATRLFEGPGRPIAPPFASYYLNGKQLMGPEAISVQKAYLASQLLLVDARHLPPDHLALELDFMSVLAREETEKALADSRSFLSKHLLSWIPAWRSDVLAAQPHSFFAGLANFTHAVLIADMEWLNTNSIELAPEIVGALEEVK